MHSMQLKCVIIIRLHRMHEMQSVLTDVCGVCLSICQSRGSTRLHCAKTAEWIQILFGVNSLGAQGTLC